MAVFNSCRSPEKDSVLSPALCPSLLSVCCNPTYHQSRGRQQRKHQECGWQPMPCRRKVVRS
eukprot:scaffold538001_cov47-Prasinocladus_malaysianus.AAC.1